MGRTMRAERLGDKSKMEFFIICLDCSAHALFTVSQAVRGDLFVIRRRIRYDSCRLNEGSGLDRPG